MKNILLISNKVFHYRVPIYNYFYEAFGKDGYNFMVLTNKLQEDFEHQPKFDCIVKKPSFRNYKAVIKESEPAAVIFFMHLKDWVMWPMLYWLKSQKIPVIYWNHGVNLQDPDNRYKNILFYHLHDIADAIVLYSPNEEQYISSKNRDKISIGYNTLNFHEFPVIEKDKAALKAELNIPYKKVILFAARINPARRLDLLLDTYLDVRDYETGLVIVGGGELSDRQKAIIDQDEGILYLGKVTDQVKFNKLVKLSDVFTIPGKSGLAINQAFYWSVPYITTNVKQSPEIWYLVDGYNGFVADINKEDDYRNKLSKLLEDDELRETMAKNAAKTAREKAAIHKMFNGFSEAVNAVSTSTQEKIKI